MSFAGMNVWAIVLAALAAFGFGLLYRGGWRAARPTAGLLAATLAAELVTAWVLAGTLGHLGPGQVTLKNGLISALFVWAGFMATAVAVGYRGRGLGWGAVLTDAGHRLGAALVTGAVIGGMGV